MNLASRSGFARQYAGLEALYRSHRDRGPVVLGFPANDFKGQEPGTETEIAGFCRVHLRSRLDAAKRHVGGPDRHPLYRALEEARPEAWIPAGSTLRQHLPEPSPGEMHWNFGKPLIGRAGEVVRRFGSAIGPENPIPVQAIETALAASA